MNTKLKSLARGWRLPVALIALAAVPTIAGVVRVAGLAGAAEVTPENARFFAAPVPVVLHIVSAVLLLVFGAFQLVPRLQRTGWHRGAGRVLVVAGLVAGLTALWMTVFYPRVTGDSDLLDVLRLGFGSAMIVCIVLGVIAIRRRDIAQHGAWMTRAYAIGAGAGTQVLVHIPFIIADDMPGELGRALLLGLAWVINLAVAEWSIRRASPRASSLTAHGMERTARA